MSKVKITALSDTHGRHEEVDLEGGDILIHCGDFTFDGSYMSAEMFFEWFQRQNYSEKICIAGNHDSCLENFISRSLIPEEIVYLENSKYISKSGLKIYGSPYSPTFGTWAFMKNRGEEIAEIWKKIPEDLDMLVTHGPAFKVLDKSKHGINCGCYDLKRYIQKRKPKYHIFGHIHEGYGANIIGNTTYLNCSVLDASYDLKNKPFNFEI